MKSIVNSISNQQKVLGFTFIVYTISMLVFIPFHEPWADEAQSWLLARDSSLWELLWTNLRLEGTPGLWQLLLMIPAKFLPYASLNYISGLAAIIGCYLILFKSPLPIWLRVLLPFSYFLFFQYGIVARSYSLLIPLLFGIATIYKARFDRPFLFIFLIILLANVSLHGSLMAFAIMVDHLLYTLINRRDFKKNLLIQQSLIALLFLLAGLFIIFQLAPPKNVSYDPAGFIFKWSVFFDTSAMVIKEVFTENSIVSYIVLIVSCFWFYTTKKLFLFILGLICILILFSFYYSPWHQGTIFLYWIFVLWLSLIDSNHKQANSNIEYAIKIAVAITLIIQINWNVNSLMNDVKGQYSAGKELANYIEENHFNEQSIFAYRFWPVAVQPYFDDNIYSQYHYKSGKSFWTWTKGNDWMEPVDDMIKNNNPDMIIFPKPHLYDMPEQIEGYHEIQPFIGSVFWKKRIYEYTIFRVFIKNIETQHL